MCVCVVFLFSASNRPNLEHATQQWYYDNEDESSLNNDIIVFFLFVIFHYMMIVAAATKHVQILSNHFQINVQPISSHSTCACVCVCVCARATFFHGHFQFMHNFTFTLIPPFLSLTSLHAIHNIQIHKTLFLLYSRLLLPQLCCAVLLRCKRSIKWNQL